MSVHILPKNKKTPGEEGDIRKWVLKLRTCKIMKIDFYEEI